MSVPNPPPLHILLVDDFAPFRLSLRRLFQAFPALAVVGEARDGSAAIEMALSLVPQVVIMDIKMPRLGGVEATRRIKRILPETHVIGVSLNDDALTQQAMKAAGSSAFLSKCCVRDLPQLIATVTGRRVSEEGPS